MSRSRLRRLRKKAERQIRSSSISMSRRMSEIPSMHPSVRKQGRFASTGSMMAEPGLRTVSSSRMVTFMTKLVLWRMPGQKFRAARSLISWKRRQRKPGTKPRGQGRSCHSRKNISWSVTSMRKPERSLMNLRPGRFQRSRNTVTRRQLQPAGQ